MRLWDPATGAITQALNVEEPVTALEFSHNGLYLHTNLGPLDIESRCAISTSYSPHANLGISTEDEQWIK